MTVKADKKKKEMVVRKEKGQTCDKGFQEDGISKLPDLLLSHNILCHLATKDVVRTSVLSTRWRKLWKWVPGLELYSRAFSNLDDFLNFADRFFDFHKESWIRKLKLCIYDPDSTKHLSSWVDAVNKRRVQQLDVRFDNGFCSCDIPVSVTSETLVDLRLSCVVLVDSEFFSLPCLKIMHLEYVRSLNYKATVEKLISGAPVLEDLTIGRYYTDMGNVIQVRSQTVKRINLNAFAEVVIDAPLLQFLKTVGFGKKNFKIINTGFPAKLDIDVIFDWVDPEFDQHNLYYRSVVLDFLTDISKVSDLVISSNMWEEIFLYSELEPLLQFPYISCLNAGYFKRHLELLPTLLESCPKLESLILEEKLENYRMKDKEPINVRFTTVPQCLLSSLKFVELKCSRSISEYIGVMELIRYFLKNSRILEKLTLENYHYTEEEKYAIHALPRCSSACEVIIH